MSLIELKESDFIANKNPRMPISFVIDSSDYLKENASDRISIEQGIKSLLEQIKKTISMTAVVDLNIICFAENAEVVRGFASVKDGEEFKVKLMDGKPDISKAIELMLKEQKVRKNDYEMNMIKHYVPVTMVISCGKNLNTVPAAIDQINFLDRTGAMSVLGIMIGDGDDAELKKLTFDGNNIFRMNEMNYKQIFKMFGNSIESISKSSINAMNSLRNKITEWKDYKCEQI